MKSFKGVISNWSLYDDRIHGICEHHTSYDNGIEQNKPITTSIVIRITKMQGSAAMRCETKNSIYILV